MIGVIVEGHGEVCAVPVLIRRVAAGVPDCYCPLIKIHRIPKSKLLKLGELERSLEVLSRQLGNGRPILVLLDADGSCPVDLAGELSRRCGVSHPHLAVSVVVAHHEFENWFIAAIESLSGSNGLVQPLLSPPEPENIANAKEWISGHMAVNRSYSETRHQASFSAGIQLGLARRCRSFRKFEKEVIRLLNSLS